MESMSAPQIAAAAELVAFQGLRAIGENRGMCTSQPPRPPAGASSVAPCRSHVPTSEYVCPEKHLLSLLEKRGWAARIVSSSVAGYHVAPTEKQIRDYESKPFMSDLVRRGDLDGLRKALDAGRGMVSLNTWNSGATNVAQKNNL